MNYTTKYEEGMNGDLFELEEFLDCCEGGMFIDYDGYGHPVEDGMINESVDVYPSKRHLIEKEVTHILWFNR